MYKFEESQVCTQLRYLFIILSNNQTKHSLHYIDNINLQSLHRIQHNAFNTLHLSNCFHHIAFNHIAFVTLYSLHRIHHIALIIMNTSLITLHSLVPIHQIELSIFIVFVAFKASQCIHHIAFVAVHLSNCIHNIAFITLNSSHCIHHIALII